MKTEDLDSPLDNQSHLPPPTEDLDSATTPAEADPSQPKLHRRAPLVYEAFPPPSASVPFDTIDLPSSDPSVLPTVDVIVPAYNAGKTIEEAVESVFGQSYPGRIKVCVYDDSSSDETAQLLAAMAAKYTSSPTPNRSLVFTSGTFSTGAGAGYARNRAVELGSQNLLI